MNFTHTQICIYTRTYIYIHIDIYSLYPCQNYWNDWTSIGPNSPRDSLKKKKKTHTESFLFHLLHTDLVTFQHGSSAKHINIFKINKLMFYTLTDVLKYIWKRYKLWHGVETLSLVLEQVIKSKVSLRERNNVIY